MPAAGPILDLASLIRFHRRRAGLSQIELATLADVSRKVVQELESGGEGVAWRNVRAVLSTLNVSLHPAGPLIAEWQLAKVNSAADRSEPTRP